MSFTSMIFQFINQVQPEPTENLIFQSALGTTNFVAMGFIPWLRLDLSAIW